jgi:hypothetical protein
VTLRTARIGAASVGALLAAVLAGGCTAAPIATSTTTPTTTGALTARLAPTPPAAPRVHACYALPFAAVLSPSNDSRPLTCTTRHTSETVYVGRFDPLVDGHLLAVDSDQVQQQIARTCQSRTGSYLRGSRETLRLSRLQSAWFSPTLAQADAGATWFRCDLVLLSGPEALAPLPGHTAGALRNPAALRRYGTCGTASPASVRFQRIGCWMPHGWRARATIPLPRGAGYLSRAAGRSADQACHTIESSLATNVQVLQWSFEWPTKAQWTNGQRYGYCWTPDRS